MTTQSLGRRQCSPGHYLSQCAKPPSDAGRLCDCRDITEHLGTFGDIGSRASAIRQTFPQVDHVTPSLQGYSGRGRGISVRYDGLNSDARLVL